LCNFERLKIDLLDLMRLAIVLLGCIGVAYAGDSTARASHLKRSAMPLWIDSIIGTEDATGRPDPSQRTFNSSVINGVIDSFNQKLADPAIAQLFTNCYPNTLDTTVKVYDSSKPDTFVITGDINAMWLRDSANQVFPYLRFISQDSNLENMVCGLALRHAESILFDPYANSFNPDLDPTPNYDQNTIRTPQLKKGVCTGNYELDSLAAFFKLSYGVYKYSGNSTDCFRRGTDATMWARAVELAYDTIKTQQAGSEEELKNPAYVYQSRTFDATGTLMLHGNGVVAKRIGLSKSPFRPSDDANTLPFNIPVNAMTSVELAHVAEVLKAMGGYDQLTQNLLDLSDEIRQAIYKYGVVKENGKSFFAYEVDGFGDSYIMDDANIPSLLSLPYLGFCDKDDPLYLATREVVLSERNPYYFNGTVGEGIGGPHVGLGYIWPMSIITRALTTDDDQEILTALRTLKAASTDINIPFMHESFWRDDATDYTRSWFAWANSLFGEMVLTLADEKPHLIMKSKIAFE
jgi:meiotically up-regulated gene 157 (Mug157) protein